MYVDELNVNLKICRIVSRVTRICINKLSYADALALILPDAKSLNTLLKICDVFAAKYYVTFRSSKTDAMLIFPRGMR